jgi:beta-galactosidase
MASTAIIWAFTTTAITGFAYDLTPYLNDGPAGNVLAVRVDDSTQPDSRWYTGAGIYRHTWLTATSPVHVAHWGTYVSTPGVSDEQTLVLAQIRVQNDSPDIQRCLMKIEIIDAEGAVVASVQRLHALLPGQEEEFVRRLHLSRPHLWSVENPYLYRLHITLRLGDELVDEYATPFGIRTVAFDPDQGLLLNGERIKIKGVCLHHDAGCVGAAVPDRVLERRLELLKAMGCNGIRCSHYPPAPELLDMADRMGFLVMDEAFDEWAQERYAFGYHDYFDEWAIRDLESMLYRDRNHPSIVLWSVGNEIPEQTRVEGIAILQQLVDVVHRLDPTRPTVSACGHIAGPDAFDGPTQTGFLETLDVVGYNYVDRWAERRKLYYSVDHHLYPHRAVIGSENVSIAGIRGEYSASAEGAAGAGHPITRACFAANSSGSSPTATIRLRRLYVDRIRLSGESRWPHKGSSCGPLILRLSKDSYYFYQSSGPKRPWCTLSPLELAAARARSSRWSAIAIVTA